MSELVIAAQMESATLWLGLAGLAIMTILMSRGFRGSIIVGILFVTFISWIPGSAVSYLGHTSSLGGPAPSPLASHFPTRLV